MNHDALRKWLRPALLAAAAIVVLLVPVWGPPLLRHLDFFRVRHVEVAGVRYVDPREIVALLELDTTASVWDDASAWAERAARHPLVREVEMDRRLPGTLVVRLSEHAPVALVPTPQGLAVYDARGVHLPIDPTVADVNLPIVAQPDSAILHLLSELRVDAPVLYRRVSEVRPVGRDELVLVIDSLPVRAPVDVTLGRLADLELVERDLAQRQLRAVELDLRFRDQVIARLP